MCRIIFASHGDLSKGMKNSVNMLAGSLSDKVETYSLYPGESPNDYYQKLLKEIPNSDEQVIILCDIKGGSVHTTLAQLTQLNNVIVLSGMNLGMALDIVLRYQEGIPSEDYEELLDSSREGITLLTNLVSETDEGF